MLVNKLPVKLEPIFSQPRNSYQKNPLAGQIESTLEQIGEGHRYIIEGNYKIIYKKVREGILITDVFDTRQDPKKISDPRRK